MNHETLLYNGSFCCFPLIGDMCEKRHHAKCRQANFGDDDQQPLLTALWRLFKKNKKWMINGNKYAYHKQRWQCLCVWLDHSCIIIECIINFSQLSIIINVIRQTKCSTQHRSNQKTKTSNEYDLKCLTQLVTNIYIYINAATID